MANGRGPSSARQPPPDVGVAVGDGPEVAVAVTKIVLGVGGTGVDVRVAGTRVFVGVAVITLGVAVGGSGVSVGVGGTGVSVGGSGVNVAVAFGGGRPMNTRLTSLNVPGRKTPCDGGVEGWSFKKNSIG